MTDPEGRDTGRKAVIAVCLLLFFIGVVGVVSALKNAETPDPSSARTAPSHNGSSH